MRKWVYRFVVATMYFNAGLIPWYILMVNLGLKNNFLLYILPSAVGAYYVVLSKTYIESIPASVEESAKIDGAGVFRRFFRITVPLSTPMIFYNLVTGVIGAMQTNHTMVFAGYDGAGPRNSIYFIAVKIYNEGFGGQDFGYASALAWVLFVIIAILTGITFATNKWVYTGDE